MLRSILIDGMKKNVNSHFWTKFLFWYDRKRLFGNYDFFIFVRTWCEEDLWDAYDFGLFNDLSFYGNFSSPTMTLTNVLFLFRFINRYFISCTTRLIEYLVASIVTFWVYIIYKMVMSTIPALIFNFTRPTRKS